MKMCFHVYEIESISSKSASLRTLIYQPVSEEVGERIIKAFCEDRAWERLSCHEEFKPFQYRFLGG